MDGDLRCALVAFLVLLSATSLPGQPPVHPASTGQIRAQGLRKVTAEDEKRAKQLDEQINTALKGDRWDEAIARAEELLALRTRAQGPKHFQTADADWRLRALRRVARLPASDRVAYRAARTMNEEAEALHAKGKYAAAQPLFEKALETARRLLTDDHPEAALYYSNAAYNLNVQGKSAAAQPLFEKALAIARHLLSEDHPETAGYYDNLAYSLNAQGKYGEAQPLFEHALEARRRLLTDDHSDTAASYNNVAYNLNAQGKYAAAQPLYEKALDISRRILTDEHASTATAYNNLAINLADQGLYSQAEPLFEKAVEIYRRRLGDEHPDTANAYNNVGTNLYRQRKFAQAQPLLQKSLEVNRRFLTDYHPATARSYSNLALNLTALGKDAQARPFYEKALEIHRRLLGDDHPFTATTYNNLAMNLYAQGKHSEAQALYEKALEIHRRVLTDDHPNTAASYNNVVYNLHAQGKYAQAQPLLEKALDIRRRLLTEDHYQTAQSYRYLASNLYSQGKYVEARDLWQRAVKSLERARLRIAFTGLERAGAVEPMRTAPAAVLARLGQPAEAWQMLEGDLGRGLLDELASRQDRRLAAAERTRLRDLTAELERLDKLVETTPRNLDQAVRAKRFAELKGQHDRASIALGDFQTKLVQEHGALAGQVASLSEIQSALPADAALVAWVDIMPMGPNAADPDGEHWGVVVRSQGIPQWVAIAGSGSGGQWTSDDTALARPVWTALRSRPGEGAADLRPLVARLRAQRIDPLAKPLGAIANGQPPARRLIVLPSPAMAGIPVEALLAPDDTRTVSYAPSSTVFKYLREQPRPDRTAGLLALGDPVYELRPGQLGVSVDSNPAPAAVGEQRKLQQRNLEARSGDEKFAQLPGTRHEVEALAQLFHSNGRPTRALLGADASEPELDRLAASGELGQFGFIHLATHGVIDEAIPQRSAVILTQTGLPDPLEQVMNHKPVFDGRLTVREIQRSWDLKAELVTLSACDTALGRDAGGEGFVGFTQALLMSGARSVCLSLWRVNDRATSLLMTRFYQNLLGKRAGLSQGMPKAEALHEAKRWLRSLTADQINGELAAMERGDVRPLAKVNGTKLDASASSHSSGIRPYDHAYFWAAFVLVGDPD